GTCYDHTATACSRDASPLTPLAMPLILGGRYRLTRRLGRGGLGTVYLAFGSGLYRDVAGKGIREELISNRDVAARFGREARLAASFVHPNVVVVHDFGTAGMRAFFVMELLVGETLRERMNAHGKMAACDVIVILRQVSRAIDAAHERG